MGESRAVAVGSREADKRRWEPTGLLFLSHLLPTPGDGELGSIVSSEKHFCVWGVEGRVRTRPDLRVVLNSEQ